MKIRDTARVVYTVVGDRFSAFRDIPNVVLASELSQVPGGDEGPMPFPPSILLGQGLDATEASTLGAQCRARGLPLRPEPSPAARLAEEKEVHKARVSNVLITGPQRTGPGTFESTVCIHNDNELMLDHYSAMHIPAMVLIEAARQMFLAVTETYYIDSSVTPYRFLINTIQCQFHLPVFPLPITVRYEVLRHDEKKVQHQFDVAMAIVQADRLCVTFRVVFTAVELRVAKKQERIAALTRLRGYPAAGLDDT